MLQLIRDLNSFTFFKRKIENKGEYAMGNCYVIFMAVNVGLFEGLGKAHILFQDGKLVRKDGFNFLSGKIRHGNFKIRHIR